MKPKLPEPRETGRHMSRLDLDRIDLGDLRARIDESSGPRFWRSLEELADSPEFAEMVHREFPEAASEWADGVSRRRFLQLMSASLALGGLSACTTQPAEKIVPYVKQPEELVPGKPLFYATVFSLAGYATGVLAESHMGRPTKIEGNPEHPASLGATDLYAQASILDLYDPDRSQVVKHLGRISSWDAFVSDTNKAIAALAGLGDVRLRILTGTVTSPTLAAAIRALLAEHSAARWHQYEPAGRHSARAAARAAFGESRHTYYDLSKARVVLALDSDFLTAEVGSVRYARDFMAGRRARDGAGSMTRLYAVESTPTSTGAVADHRLPMSTHEVGQFALAVAAALGLGPGGQVGGHAADLARAVAADLQANAGAGLVAAGETASPELHILALAMNERLGNLGTTVLVTDTVEEDSQDQVESVRELAADMADGEVDVLLILGGNPVYDAPADVDFVNAMLKVSRRIHLGLSENETAEYCHWHVPATHFLEEWGDGRAFDGTASIIQPLIQPLYGGHSAVELVAALSAEGERPGEELVRQTWQSRAGSGDFERFWRRSLHDGLVADSAPSARAASVAPAAVEAAAANLAAVQDGPELTLRPDPTVFDGRFANNGWLQECPKPLTKLTWDNALMVSPAMAQRHGLQNGQLVDVTTGERTLRAAAWIHPGQAESTVSISLGYGRTRSGRVGTGTGFNPGVVRTTGTMWTVPGVRIAPVADEAYELASTQLHNNIALEGHEAEKRHLVRAATLEEFRHEPDFAQHIGHAPDRSITLMPGFEYDGHAWGLAVDLGSCTGCNACVVACQAENNIPVVGKDQVALGREMHWIRIDRYYAGELDDPEMHHQPVMCMHCEQAPCEVVCPVAATVHSDEGLNDMVYNRCVGTRYCSNNCPYKVRRFNFFKYNDTETPVLQLMRNPDVTVRFRGVMEKCTYCVQRINYARQEAKRQDRTIEDGDIQTACQQSCPTQAIVFGDLNDPDSEVSRWKSQPLNYGILEELGTWPRTTYLAKVTNPNPEVQEG